MKWERTVTVIGCHVGGEDNHVIVGGVLPPPGATMFEKMKHFEEHADWFRLLMLREPRGSVQPPITTSTVWVTLILTQLALRALE